MLKAKLQIVEVEKGDSKPLGTARELNAAILSLQSHLGFEELLRRMRLSRALLRSRLEQGSEDESRHEIRALISAYGFLERQLKQETGRPVEVTREPFAEEKEEYERLSQYIEVIGRTGPAN